MLPSKAFVKEIQKKLPKGKKCHCWSCDEGYPCYTSRCFCVAVAISRQDCNKINQLRSSDFKENEFLFEAIDTDNEKVLKSILKYPTSVALWSERNPLLYALQRNLKRSARFIIKFVNDYYTGDLISFKEPIMNAISKSGMTCLAYAMELGDEDIIRAILKTHRNTVFTELEMAACYRYPILLKYLLDRKRSSVDYDRLLCIASYEGGYRVCKYLMESCNANPFAVRSAMNWAINLRRKDVIELFKKHSDYDGESC